MEVLKIVNEKDETIHDLQKQLYEGTQIELYIKNFHYESKAIKLYQIKKFYS